MPHGPRRLLSDDVDRAGRGRCLGDLPRAFQAGRPGRGRTHPGSLVLVTRRRLVDQQAPRPPGNKAERRSDRLSPQAFQKDLAFFDTFVGPEDNWLPPDNYQEHSAPVVAHRTSPTNMGLALLANLSACDFGYISAGRLIDRTEKAFHTMESLDRHRGHFYNWYDTQSLEPLPPRYVSTADSGNLASHLLTLRPGLLALADQEILGPRWVEGLSDTLEILSDIAGGAGEAASARIAQIQEDLSSASDLRPFGLAATRSRLDRLAASAGELQGCLDVDSGVSERGAKGWASAFARQCRDALDEMTFLAPWSLQPAPPGVLGAFPAVDEVPTLRELARFDVALLPDLEGRLGSDPNPEEREWLDVIGPLVKESSRRAGARIAAVERLALQCGELADMEYGFLCDRSRHLMAIGYHVGERRRDPGYYDLLASEARSATFVAIAGGQLPQESWFSLGRLLTTIAGDPILLSWSGSMFEYLMPLLVMPTYQDTLLDRTYKAAVQAQIAYGRKRGVPWGMSESGYNAVDVHRNYQYRAFGVPDLGLKRGLADDLVIAPYASALALMVEPEEACLNLQRLAAEGLEGGYGFYEAVDYTPSRLPRGKSSAVVRSFMAHHEGMSLLSLAYLLLDRPMQRRFESEPMFQATALLLQERVPKASALYWHKTESSGLLTAPSGEEIPVRVFSDPGTATPEVQPLSNGRYHVMVTNSGGGYSRWKDTAVTRWREDGTCDSWGTFCYLRDMTSGEFWSTAYQPALKGPESHEAIFSEARAEFRCRAHEMDTHTEIAVSPEDDIESRRITVTNRARTRRTIGITSYAEVVLASPAEDALHPAFGNLFVQTEIIRPQRAILCTRRPRSEEERPLWMFHLMGVRGADVGEISYETDRSRFIGRGNSVANPQAMTGPGALSGTEGSVLDPLRRLHASCRSKRPDQELFVDDQREHSAEVRISGSCRAFS